MNLRDEWLPYKSLIGQVILDVSLSRILTSCQLTCQKNKNLRTVVNKLNNIHAQYRYFDMEVLAGDKDFITQVVSFLFTPLMTAALTISLNQAVCSLSTFR